MPPANCHTPPTVPLEEMLAVVKAARALLDRADDAAELVSGKPRYVALEVMRGQSGEATYLDGYRISGASDNGAMRTIRQDRIRVDDIYRALGLSGDQRVLRTALTNLDARN